jgi:REP element-mobilizing transposase RayT
LARSIRIEYPGAFYHVMARGNRRESIYRDEKDQRTFLRTLAEACGMTGWQVHAWVLMRNHYHLLIQTPEANLVAGMQWLQNTYTRRFNTRHQLWGRLFGDRYKAVLVEGGSKFHYETLVDYIHLNPVRAGVVKPDQQQSVLDYPFSSVATGYGVPAGRRAKWLAAEAGLQMFGFKDSSAGRRQFVERLDRRALEEGMQRAGLPLLDAEADQRCSHLRRGWYWGSQTFAERALKVAEATLQRVRHRSSKKTQEGRAHGQREAERRLVQGLVAAGLDARTLAALPGSDARKVVIARVIRETSTVDMKWIADHLAMKSAANASQQIRRGKQETRKLPKALRRWVNLSRNVA